MTYPKPSPTHDDDDADEASSLLTIITASPAPSLGQNGVSATKKKNGGVLMQAMIATSCFFLSTITVIYSGGSGSSNTNRTDGTSEALLLGQNQAASMVYDPTQDFCFEDKANLGKYCWGRGNEFPCGHWKGVSGQGSGYCGPYCDDVPFLHVYTDFQRFYLNSLGSADLLRGC